MTNDLKSCPFCGGADIAVFPDEVGSGGQHVPPYYVACDVTQKGCGIVVQGETEEEAIATWNRRAALAGRAAVPTDRDLLQRARNDLGRLMNTAEMVKFQADNSGKTIYTDWGSACADLEEKLSAAFKTLAALDAALAPEDDACGFCGGDGCELCNQSGKAQTFAIASPAAAQPAERTLIVDWPTETDDPVAEMDRIASEYTTTCGTTPGPDMERTIRKVKTMLFDWWAWHRDTIRRALLATPAKPTTIHEILAPMSPEAGALFAELCEMGGQSLDQIAASLATPAPAAQPGWQMVPIEPTPAMFDAFYDAPLLDEGDDSDWIKCYRAMLAASPAPKEPT